MENWLVAVICLAITVAAVLIASIIKIIAKKKAEMNGKTINKSKLEYPLGILALVLAFGGVAAFLYFYIKLQIGVSLAGGAFYGLASEGVYVFIVQLARKGVKGAISAIIKIISKLKSSKNPIAEAPAIIAESTEESTAAEESETAETLGKKLYEDIFKE